MVLHGNYRSVSAYPCIRPPYMMHKAICHQHEPETQKKKNLYFPCHIYLLFKKKKKYCTPTYVMNVWCKYTAQVMLDKCYQQVVFLVLCV